MKALVLLKKRLTYQKTPSLTRLKKELRSPRYADRSKAVEKAAASRNKNAGELIIPCLKDRHYQVRYVAAEALGLLRSRKSIPYLIEALRDKEEMVRVNAAESLGTMKAQSACSALRNALKDSEPLVRGYAAEALGQIGGKENISPIRSALKKEDADTAILGFLKSLYDLGDHSRLRRILRMLDSPDYRVRCATAHVSEELARRHNALIILKALVKRQQKENTIAAAGCIQDAIAKLRSGLIPKSFNRTRPFLPCRVRLGSIRIEKTVERK